MKLIRFVPLVLALAVASPLIAQAPAAAPTFAADVAPIVYRNCAPCHRPGEATPFSLLSYDDVKRRAKLIASVTNEGYMPPWHARSEVAPFHEDRRLSDKDVRTLADWYEAGMPRGDASKEPAVPRFTPGWQLGEPDLVVRMADAMQIPEDGPDLFRNFAIPLNLTEDKWVRAIEFRPSGKASHHALFFFDVTGNALAEDARDPAPGFGGMSFLAGQGGLRGATSGQGGTNALRALLSGGASEQAQFGTLGGWAVGGRPAELPDVTARKLPAGSALVLQMHFHPDGKPETEQATIGIYFAKAAPRRTLIELQLPSLFGALAGIDLPAGARRTVINDSYTLPVDVDVLGAGGHAHYLATDMHMKITPPGGATRELFSIANWDFNWQERYFFEQPVRLKAGTRVDVEIAYDNSDANPANPFNPPRRVRFGQQSTDEMGSITLEMLPVDEADIPRYAESLQQHVREGFVKRLSGAVRGAGAGLR